MTLIEAIEMVDNLKPNQYDYAMKIKWLSDLDRSIVDEIISQHENPDNVAMDFNGYNEETDQDTMLIVNDPYSDIYVQYLIMKIDYFNNEPIRYNNSATMFNSRYLEYAKWYNRQYKSNKKYKYKAF
jgi:hypothetical protein